MFLLAKLGKLEQQHHTWKRHEKSIKQYGNGLNGMDAKRFLFRFWLLKARKNCLLHQHSVWYPLI